MSYLNDLVGLAGICAVGGGLWLVDMRLALVVVGSILLFVAYRGASR